MVARSVSKNLKYSMLFLIEQNAKALPDWTFEIFKTSRENKYVESMVFFHFGLGSRCCHGRPCSHRREVGIGINIDPQASNSTLFFAMGSDLEKENSGRKKRDSNHTYPRTGEAGSPVSGPLPKPYEVDERK